MSLMMDLMNILMGLAILGLACGLYVAFVIQPQHQSVIDTYCDDSIITFGNVFQNSEIICLDNGISREIHCDFQKEICAMSLKPQSSEKR